jgi:adenylate cyclase
MRTIKMPKSAHTFTKTILEMDLVGYSDLARMLEENLDVGAVKALEEQILQFIDYGLTEIGLQRNDIVIDTAGDNAILMFDDAATMHAFAQAIQTQILVHNVSKSFELAKRWFRMGAATGTVLIMPADRKIFGSTISRAVRLEAAAEIGQLVIDLPTFDALPDNLKTTYRSSEIIHGKRAERFEARRCTLINVPKTSRKSIRPAPNRSRIDFRSEASPRASLDDRPAIAVLPFANIGDDPDQTYLSDGITEDVINELASWRLFPVIARSSTFLFRGQAIDITQLGKKIGARYIVEGSINKIGQRVRISARLVDVVTCVQLAAERFDQNFDEITRIQDQVAEMIVGAMAPEVLRIERHRVLQKR